MQHDDRQPDNALKGSILRVARRQEENPSDLLESLHQTNIFAEKFINAALYWTGNSHLYQAFYHMRDNNPSGTHFCVEKRLKDSESISDLQVKRLRKYKDYSETLSKLSREDLRIYKAAYFLVTRTEPEQQLLNNRLRKQLALVDPEGFKLIEPFLNSI